MKGNKKVIVSLVMILLLIAATIGVTFAAFTFTKEGTVENTLETSTIMLTYTEGKTGITLNEVYPMSDEQGKILTGENNVFDFTVQATLGKSNVISYEVTAVKIPIEETTTLKALQDTEVKLYLERAVDPDTTYQEVLAPSNFIPIENQTEVGSPVGSMILDSGAFFNEGITIHNYRLRMWVAEDAEIPSGEARKYGVKVNVYAKQLMRDYFTDESCFTFDSTTGTIKGYSDDCSTDVVIPYTINGVVVRSIRGGRGAAFAFKNLTSVKIPNSVANIEGGAFRNNKFDDEQVFVYNRNSDGSINYTSLNSYGGKDGDIVIVPDQVTKIDSYAFQGILYSDIELPDNLTIIGDYALASGQFSEIIIPPNVNTIGACAISTTPNLIKIINQTGRSFDWYSIIRGTIGTPFVTGSVGNVIITEQ